MIEVHNSPELAMTDSAQQLSLGEFHNILGVLGNEKR